MISKKESHRDFSFPPLLYVPSLYQLCKYSKLNYIAKSVKISTADWVLSLKKIFFWVQNIVIECAIESINWDWDERIIVWGKWNIELKNKLRNEDYIDNRNRTLDHLKDH